MTESTTEEALRSSELIHLLTETSWPIIVLSPSGQILGLSRPMLELLATDEAAVLGKPIEALVLDHERDHIRSLLEQAAASRPAALARVHLQRRDQLPLTVELEALPNSDDSEGRITLIVYPRSLTHRREQLILELNRLGPVLLVARSAGEVFTRVAQALWQVGLRTAILLLNPEGTLLHVHYTNASPVLHDFIRRRAAVMISQLHIPADVDPYRTVLEQRRAIFWTDIPTMLRAVMPPAAATISRGLLQLQGIRGFIVAPLLAGEQQRGVLVLWGQILSHDDVPFVEVLGHQIAAVLAQIDLRYRMEQQIQRLDSLAATARAVTTLGSLEDVLRVVCRQAQELLGAELASIALPTEDTDSLVCVMATGIGAERLLGMQLPIAASLAGKVLRSGQGICIVDTRGEPEAYLPALQAGRQRAALFQPLFHQGSILGVLVVSHGEPGRFTPADLEYLARYAEYAAVAVANAQLHAALQQSEQRYRLLVEQAAEAVISLAPDGTIRHFNQAARRMIGYTEAEIAQIALCELLDPMALAESKDRLARLLQHEPVEMPWTVRARRKDGRRLMLEITAQVLWQGDQPLEVEVIGRDVTQRLEYEAEQQREARALAALVRVSEAINHSLDLDTILHQGLRALHDVGLATFSSIQLLHPQKGWLELRAQLNLPPELIASMQCIPIDSLPFPADLRAGRIRVVDHDMLQQLLSAYPGLAELHVSSAALIPLMAEAKLLGSLNVGLAHGQSYTGRDLQLLQAIATQLAQAVAKAQVHQALQETAAANEALYRAAAEVQSYLNTLIHSTPDVLLTIRRDMTMRLLNPERLTAITGYRPEEVIGQPFLRFVPERLHQELVPRWHAVLAGQPQSFEIEIVKADGGSLIAMLSAALISEYDEVFVIIKDMTAQRQLEAQLRQNEKLAALGSLVAGTAHELNNPLAAILGLVQLQLLEDLPPTLRADLENIERAALRISQIVQQLRTFAHPQPPQPQPIGLEALVRATLARLASELTTHNVEIEIDLDPTLPRPLGDPRQIEQVLFNIIHNALLALMNNPPSRPRRLTIRGWLEQHEVRLAISDSGPGIAPEHLARIFEPFFTTRAVGQGTGLGLSIAHAIVQRHNGRIWAESRPGHGTTLHLALRPAPTDTDPLPAGEPRPAPEVQRVFIDDEA